MLKIENEMKGLKETLPERHHYLLPVNEKAIIRGMEVVQLENKAELKV